MSPSWNPLAPKHPFLSKYAPWKLQVRPLYVWDSIGRVAPAAPPAPPPQPPAAPTPQYDTKVPPIDRTPLS
jgi:hypothetical protein